mgnify:CR=1 FL=1
MHAPRDAEHASPKPPALRRRSNEQCAEKISGKGDEGIEPAGNVIEVQDAAYDWVMANHDAAIALGAKEQGISIEDAQKLYDWSHYTKRLNEADIKSMDEDLKFLLENGMMRNSVETRSFILDRALEPAAK